MISIKSTTNTQPIDDLMAYLDSQNQIVGSIVREVYSTYAPELLTRLQAEPPPAKKPIDWTSEKQRKFVMAKLREEKNLPYKRTHQLSEAWEVVNSSEAGMFQIIVKNPAPTAKYVYGTLARDPLAARAPQQQFHINTGWQSASETVRFYLDAMKEEFIKRYDALIGEFGRRGSNTKAFTR